MSKFDPFGDLERGFGLAFKSATFGFKVGRNLKARSARLEVEERYGPEVADAVEADIRAGRDPRPRLERAERDRLAREERERQLADPPTLYGSARWPTSSDLQSYLRDKAAFDDPRSILLGTFNDENNPDPAGYVHWNGDGHLLTIAPTRSGKALTTIIPNLLRYQGSCVILDPKGELFEATSKWRSTLGPVYRIAPFNTDANKPAHRFDPVRQVESEADARAIAQQIFPRDAHASSYFMDDAEGFLTAVIIYVRRKAPPNRQTLATVCQMASLKGQSLLRAVQQMEAFPPTATTARAILEKDPQRGLKVLQETLTSKLNRWLDAEIQASTAGNDLDFKTLKDRTATVYIEIPFHMMKTYAGWLRVVLKAALDAMLTNPREPCIPVLFVLDEFLNIGPFPEYRDAIRTHAGAGVRLWFFLQDIYSIEEHYPGNSWRPFLNCAVKQFFGVNDDETAKMIGGYLGHKTHAIRTTSSSANVSSHHGGWTGDASTNSGFSMTEGIQFLGRPLMTHDEVKELLGGWQADGWRYGITDIAGLRPFKTQLVVHQKSEICRQRIGMMDKGE
ncbi:type IV secretory system conjugative DNA transfer family protein [Agrobacterium tumefaciens]|uniref:type IV secretory system conjugative DNA transfer family protein n=1 Tax=Agrobacterium tumefaciens TaxID=358 RepID=UPI001572832B|nr:type IV secretory system conjugative DNA transfer family protein [Agrobacterium tumefaciens]NTD91104.1 type IV secretory system conjugative DNA transfer family protein [Agrobacterium tumefaciens]NTD98550.1 type IV secretory system conjugative DNA transfer family protein [Agrobacterium tumefaciens]NTE11932.1 type IV secretory system conjugative DNA transfer family protein [Agrobacterium tumefaciens]NTE20008.1 type IV secretory system conjugative DNA transfer family protein [Agrobacterium tume